MTSIPTHNGEVGVIYLAVTLQAGGGTPPYSWAATGMPPGLTVSPQGVVTGNNTTAGKYSFTATVTDSTGATATGTQSMTVFPPLTVSQPCAQACYVGMGCTVCGRFGTVSGGAGPYHFKQAGGVVPQGMTLNGFALQGPFPVPQIVGCAVACDVIAAGPPITKIPWNLSASVTDDFGVTKTVAANFLEFFPIQFSNCSLDSQCTSVTNAVPDTTIKYAFGAPSDSVSVSVVQVCDINHACKTDVAGMASLLPPNWSVSAKAGTVTAFMDCTNQAACANGFYADIYIVLVDHGACVAPQFAQTFETIVNVDV